VLLPPPELRAPAEFHSEVLSGGISAGGSARLDAARVRVDERFLTQHAALVPEELAERWPDVVAAVLPYLGEWIERLPRAQRVLLRLMYREGMTLREARRARRITRQSAWVAYRRAKRRLVARIEALLAERLTDAKG
jgi:DNA-directed RNA polymerase specialized sigma24 family protein